MKNKIIFLVGLSGSGKSTWATNYIQNNRDTYRINRDDVRRTIVGDLNTYWDRPDCFYIESMVSSISIQMLSIYTNKKFNIIIDNTNLTFKEINSLLSLINQEFYDVEFVILDKPIRECKENVQRRDNREDVSYIDKHANRFIQIIKWIKEHYPDNYKIIDN